MTDDSAVQRWADASIAAALFAVDPHGTGGVVLHALAGPARDAWLDGMRCNFPAGTSLRRVPLHISDDRLLGGLELAATLRAGRPIVQRGVLAEADGGAVLLAMAERVTSATAARIAAVLDAGAVLIERDGLTLSQPARIGVIALDESIEADEGVATALLDRLAFRVDLCGLRSQDDVAETYSAAEIESARLRLPSVRSDAAIEEALCATALALGVDSMRAVLLSLRAARASAALTERDVIDETDASLAARLVLMPRATQLPSSEAQPEEADADSEHSDPPDDSSDASDQAQPEGAESPPSNKSSPEEDQDDAAPIPDKAVANLVLAAALAAMPSGLLAQLKQSGALRQQTRSSGKAGIISLSSARGRPAGSRRGDPRAGVRLNLSETLRAAAPWQRLRQREYASGNKTSEVRVQIRREDSHITRYKKRSESTTIFVVDASGSAALNRLAEAKGAVELLLADCYVRRDRVALISFRGRGAELLLPPTRSLVRAKRSLAGLPGGGGTPLAAAIDAALALADSVRRHGETPSIVLLTDGSANVASDGSGDRARAAADALAAARHVRAAGLSTLFIDTSPRAQAFASQLAEAMRATYLPLPYADAATLSAAVRASGATALAR